MSYYSRQNLLVAPSQKWDEDAHPRVPAGEAGGGQFTSGGGEGGGGGGSTSHHPISYGKGRYGVERVEATGGKSQQARGRTPEEFGSMEEARAHAERLDNPPVRHHPVSFGSEGYGVERVAETGGKAQQARGATPERFQTMEEARAHAEALDKPKPGYFGRNLEGQRTLIGPPGDRMAKLGLTFGREGVPKGGFFGRRQAEQRAKRRRGG
jgi:hypothetical protein